MATSYKSPAEVKWAVRQRFQYIETMAYYTGLVSRSDVAKTFGLSDAAATKDLKAYNEQAPDNLAYQHSVFGFVPTGNFQAMFADLSPEVVLPMIAANLAASGGPSEAAQLYGIQMEELPLPIRLPDREVCAQVLRAVKQGKQLRVVYKSLSDRDEDDVRTIEPHSLVNTGLRWHVRAYSTESYDFRDFVLSRFVAAEMLDEEAESSAQYDDDWVEAITLQLAPHPKLKSRKQESLLIDYRAVDGVIELDVRRALVGYLLHRLSVDTTIDQSMNPNAYQLVLVNRDEVEPFAGWAF
ncbi:MAG: WYL domain-containing protein, partial [Gammaproteobacteria bacterium]|nr:WYL domain-containing protein [Gammaproteobacteria bacterium]